MRMRTQWILALGLSAGLVACGGNDVEGTSGGDTNPGGGGTDPGGGGTNPGGGGTDPGGGGTDPGGGGTSASIGKRGGKIVQKSAPFTAKGPKRSVLYVHQSTGWIVWGREDDLLKKAYQALRTEDKDVQEKAGPIDGEANYGNDPKKYEQAWLNGALLDGITQDIVVFKNCYTSDPMQNEDQLKYYKDVYNRLKVKFKSEKYKNKMFIAWTVPPMLKSEFGSGVRKYSDQLYTWLTEEWDEDGDNIFIFDYRLLATRARLLDGGPGLDYFAADDATGDSHPNNAFAAEVRPCLARRMADVANGDGDATDNVGGCRLE